MKKITYVKVIVTLVILLAITLAGYTSVLGYGQPPPRNGSIAGQKFNDINGNSVKDAGDIGLPDWEVYIYKTPDYGQGIRATSTDALGNYLWSGAPHSTYVLCETPQVGWTQTYPVIDIDGAYQCDNGTIGWQIDMPGGPTSTENTFTDIDFGNHQNQDETITVTIIKYVDGVHATAENANSTSFPFTATWQADNLNGGATTTGDFTLSPTGYNTPDPYEAVTSPMNQGASYRLTENIPTTCGEENNYALDGYHVGNSEGDALSNATTTTVNEDTIRHYNNRRNKVIIVMNHSCLVTPPPTATVTVVKYLDGVKATPESANNFSFPMTATWRADNLNGGATTSAPFDLDADGFNGDPTPYQAITSPMNLGAYYNSVENIPSVCGGENDYALDGYHIGDSENDALNNATTSDPTIENLPGNMVIIVMNHKCQPASVCTPNDPFSVASDPSTQVDGHDAVVITPHPAWTTISGATWVSSDPLDINGSSPTDVTKVYTKTFTVTGTPLDSSLEIAADNYYTVKVNGNVINTGTSGTDLDNFSSADTWTIPAADLVTGSNTIEISVTNPSTDPDTGNPFGDPNPSGVLYKLTVNSEICDDGGGDDGSTIIVSKVTENPADFDQDFSFTLTQGEDNLGNTTANDGTNLMGSFTDLGPGTYTLTEALPSGWTFDSENSICVYDDEDVGISTINGEIITLSDSSSTVHCTFYNIKQDDVIGGGGGGGTSGGGGGVGILTGVGGSLGAPTGRVLGAAVGPDDTLTCAPYLLSYLRYGRKNDPVEVTKLQTFLNSFQKAVLVITGIFDKPTFAAVKTFQISEESNIRTPWAQANVPITNNEWPTGYVYKTTKHDINRIMCSTLNEPTPPLP